MRRRSIWLTGLLVLVASVARPDQFLPVRAVSDLRLINHSQFDAAMVTLRYEVPDHTPSIVSPVRLEAGEEMLFTDVGEVLFGLSSEATGVVVVSAPDSVEAQWRPSGGRVPQEWLPSIASMSQDSAEPVADGIGRHSGIGLLTLPGDRYPTNNASASTRRRAAGPGLRMEPPTLVRVGDTARFSGSHGVSGTITILEANVLRITNLRHDGSAPGLDLRVGLSTVSRKAFTVLQVTGRQPFDNASIDLTLPASIDLNSFDTFTVWCYEFNSVIAEGRFRRP